MNGNLYYRFRSQKKDRKGGQKRGEEKNVSDTTQTNAMRKKAGQLQKKKAKSSVIWSIPTTWAHVGGNTTVHRSVHKSVYK